MGTSGTGSLRWTAYERETKSARAVLRPRVLVVSAVTLTLALAGCARPTGDFGRAKPSVLHDSVMPLAGEQTARNRGEPVSKFNLTNDEELLRDRGWGLIRPPAAKDWIGGTKVELTRTRMLPEADGRVPPDLYYIYLRSDKFRSSDARYDRLSADARADSKLVLPFCEVARRVQAADTERLRALNNRELVTEEIYNGAKARVWENSKYVDWVAQALNYRVAAYKIAARSLEIETPSSNRLWQANTSIRDLEQMVKLAENGCEPEGEAQLAAPVKKSRIYTGWGTEKPAPKK